MQVSTAGLLGLGLLLALWNVVVPEDGRRGLAMAGALVALITLSMELVRGATSHRQAITIRSDVIAYSDWAGEQQTLARKQCKLYESMERERDLINGDLRPTGDLIWSVKAPMTFWYPVVHEHDFYRAPGGKILTGRQLAARLASWLGTSLDKAIVENENDPEPLTSR